MNRNGAAGKPVVEVEVADGKANARFEKAIPVVAPYPAVEFFPEGGDLVAGVPNRVYVRAQTPQGAPVDLDARLVDQQGKEVARVQTLRSAGPITPRGVGAFTFTPQAGDAYKLQFAAPGSGPAAAPLPAVHALGVALSVPEAVGREGEPIRAVVRHAGTERRLLVLATCRGQVVDQQFITASPAGADVRLTPVPGTRGVVRLTVYEVQKDRLVPRAERLVYQMPTERLDLAIANAGKDGVVKCPPGARTNLTFKAVSEKGEPTSAIFLAAAVAEQALPSAAQAEQGPPAYFYLTSQVRGGEDLENANFLVSDAPQARAALDLFLATEGWRRFAEPASGTMVTQADADQPAVFSRNNFVEAAARYEAALAAGREELRRQALQEREALQEERHERTAAVAAAAAALRDYEELPRRVFRTAVGVLVLLLLGAGGLCLIGGFLRAVRGGRPTVAFAAAFTSLLLCLVIYGATGDLRQEDHAGVDLGLRAQLSDRELPRLPEAVPVREQQRPDAERNRTPEGRFAEMGEVKQATALAARPAVDAAAGRQARSLQKNLDMLRRRAGEDPFRGGGKEIAANKSEQTTAKAKGDSRAQSGGMPPPGTPAPAPIAPVASPAPPARGAPEDAMGKKPGARPDTPEAKADKDAVQERLSLREFAYRADRAGRDLSRHRLVVSGPCRPRRHGSGQLRPACHGGELSGSSVRPQPRRAAWVPSRARSRRGNDRRLRLGDQSPSRKRLILRTQHLAKALLPQPAQLHLDLHRLGHGQKRRFATAGGARCLGVGVGDRDRDRQSHRYRVQRRQVEGQLRFLVQDSAGVLPRAVPALDPGTNAEHRVGQ